MSEMLAGKVAVVTGAGGGIGRGIALAMAAAGAKVVVNDIGASLSGDSTSAGPAQQVAEEIIKAGGKAVPNTDSVATRASANNIIQTAIEQFGRIDIVVNNAGNLRDRVFHKMSDEEWTQVIDVPMPTAVEFERPSGGINAITEAARLLSGAKFPVILSGAGVVLGNAIPECAALAERLDAPVCSNYQHNDSFPGSHPLAAGPLGYTGSRAAMELIAKADVVLALGTRLNPFSTDRKSTRLNSSH